MPIDKAVLDALVAGLKNEKRLVEKNGRLALPEHRSTFGGEDAKLLETIESLFREKLFSPPDAAEVATRTGTPAAKVAKLLGLLREHGRLVQVDAATLFHSEAVARAAKSP